MKRSMLVAGLLFGFTAAAAHADCKSEVDQAFSKLRGGKGFRLETKIVHEKQGTLNMTVDYVLPDRMHQRVRLGNSPALMETIAIGTKVWANQGQGWSEVPQNFAEVISSQLKEQIAAPSKSDISYECLGDITFEGKDYVAYRAALPVPAEESIKGEEAQPAETENVQTVYVDKETGLPARNIVTKSDEPDKRLFDGTFSTPSNVVIKAPG